MIINYRIIQAYIFTYLLSFVERVFILLFIVQNVCIVPIGLSVLDVHGHFTSNVMTTKKENFYTILVHEQCSSVRINYTFEDTTR